MAGLSLLAWHPSKALQRASLGNGVPMPTFPNTFQRSRARTSRRTPALGQDADASDRCVAAGGLAAKLPAVLPICFPIEVSGKLFGCISLLTY
jgi:hypothetical protein